VTATADPETGLGTVTLNQLEVTQTLQLPIGQYPYMVTSPHGFNCSVPIIVFGNLPCFLSTYLLVKNYKNFLLRNILEYLNSWCN